MDLWSYRNANRSNSMKYLTRNDHLEEVEEVEEAVAAKPQSPNTVKATQSTDGAVEKDDNVQEEDKFYFPPQEETVPEEDALPATVASSAQSTIRGEYYYKYAVNEGLGHLDKIDSSHINLSTPSECDGVSIDGLREPPVLFTTPETASTTDLNNQPGAFTKGPRRLSTRKNENVFAWKLFSSQN